MINSELFTIRFADAVSQPFTELQDKIRFTISSYSPIFFPISVKQN